MMGLALLLSLSRLEAAEVVDRLVAVVGDEIITQSDVKNFSKEKASESKLLGIPVKDSLESVIREKILKEEFKRLEMNTTDQEVEQAIQEILQRNRTTLEVMKGELAKKGTTLDDYKKELSGQIRRMKFLTQVIFPKIKISEEEVNRKAGKEASEEARFQARMGILQGRSADKIIEYLDEARARIHVEIKK